MPYADRSTQNSHRVRELMKQQDLDALVVRAPDNIVYLTNYWCMKGYDIAIFPREGEPTLIALEPQEEDARRTSWTQGHPPVQGLSPERSTSAQDRARSTSPCKS